MRDRNDLETFVSAVSEAVGKQVGKSMNVEESEYSERDGMIIHRLGFTAQMGGAPGCAGAPQAGAQPALMRMLFVDYFLRPKDSDAQNYRLICRGTAAAMEALKPEIEFIAASLRYTGELDEEFFVPDAPLEKVASAEDAQKGAASGKRSSSWFMPLALIAIIWMMIRKRKKKQQEAA